MDLNDTVHVSIIKLYTYSHTYIYNNNIATIILLQLEVQTVSTYLHALRKKFHLYAFTLLALIMFANSCTISNKTLWEKFMTNQLMLIS